MRHISKLLASHLDKRHHVVCRLVHVLYLNELILIFAVTLQLCSNDSSDNPDFATFCD